MQDYHAIIIGGFSFDTFGRPLGPYRLRSAFKKAGYNVKIIDYASVLSFDQLFDIFNVLITDKTLAIGISSVWFTQHTGGNLWFCQEFFDQFKIKFPKVKIVIGGTKNATLDLMYYNCDWRITGYADISFPLLLDKLSGKQVNLKFMLESSMKKVIHSDDLYPVQNMNDLEIEMEQSDNFFRYQPFSLEVSRGCVFQCKFCTHPFLGKKSYEYIRSPENLARELKRNYDLFKITRYNITDSTFNDSLEKLEILDKAIELSGIPKFEFVSYIRAELLVTKPEMIPYLKKLGLKGYHVGLESFGKEARKVVGKGLDLTRVLDSIRKLNSDTGAFGHCSLITGLPGDTVEDFDRWIEILSSSKNELFRSWYATPLVMNQAQDGSAYSEFEKNPEIYGYTLIPSNKKTKDEKNWYGWKHTSGMNLKIAFDFAKKINDCPDQLIAGWEVSSAWFAGYENQEIENTKHDRAFSRSVRSLSVIRGFKEYISLTKKIPNIDHLKIYMPRKLDPALVQWIEQLSPKE